MATRAGSDETLTIPGMPAIEPRMIDVPDAGGDGGDEVGVDSLVQAVFADSWEWIPDPCEISVSVCLPFNCALMLSHCNMNDILSS